MTRIHRIAVVSAGLARLASTHAQRPLISAIKFPRMWLHSHLGASETLIG